MTQQSSPTSHDLQVITEEVWASYLDPEGTSPLKPQSDPDPHHDICAAVSITGGWNGHVVVSCSAAASRHAAAALLGLDAADVSIEDVADALGEVANVIGGNVKSLLADSCALSLPHVVPFTAGTPMWPAVTEVCRHEATWLDEPITITVLESKADRQTAVPV